MRRAHRFVTLVPVLVITGCTRQDTAPSDGGMPGPDVELTPDSEFYPWDGSVDLFGPCSADDQCRYAVGAQCLTTYPGGLCTLRCEPNGQECGPEGTCVLNVCVPACASTDNCRTVGGMCDRDTYCAPSCGAGSAPCATGTVCDPYSAACTSQPTTSGADNGAPCTSDDQCRGFCLSDGLTGVDGNPVHGYLGGMCVSYARAPDRDTLFDGGPLPTSNCPAGSVIVPPFNAAGDLTLCLPECHGDADCRPGYACWTTDGTDTYSDGYCAPIDCADHCPAPSACALDSGACAP